jgi:hypothetical protein
MVIERLGPSEAVKVVGVVQATDSDMEGQLEDTLSKLEGFVEGFQECFVPRRLAWTGMRTMIWPSTAYPFTACDFNEKEAAEINKTLKKMTISKMGIAKNFPKEYLHN